jgi:AcrR family transcriptional regulator
MTSAGRPYAAVMPSGRDHPLALDDWIEAGFALLAEGGFDSLRISRLCARLDVTKGSFYWHFEDIKAYRAALVDAWSELRTADRRRLISVDDVEPRRRLALMMGMLARPEHWAVERVMRAWALTDDRVAERVRGGDRRVLRAVRQAFADYGFAPGVASLRAALLFSAGIGLLHGSDPAVDAPPELREEVLDFLLRE